MKATIKGIEVSGTPEEIAEFISLSKPDISTEKKPQYASGGFTGTRNEPWGIVHPAKFWCDFCKQPIVK